MEVSEVNGTCCKLIGATTIELYKGTVYVKDLGVSLSKSYLYRLTI